MPVKPLAPLPAPRPGGHRAPVCRNALAPQGSQHFVACHSARRFAGSCVCGRVGAWSRSPSASRSPARVSRGLERSLAVASASWLPGTLCTSVAWPRFRFSCADPETGVPFAIWGPSAHGGRCRQRSAGVSERHTLARIISVRCLVLGGGHPSATRGPVVVVSVGPAPLAEGVGRRAMCFSGLRASSSENGLREAFARLPFGRLCSVGRRVSFTRSRLQHLDRYAACK